MRKLVTRFMKNEQGAALVEYGMLVGLIAVACVGAVGTLGATISGYFDTINATDGGASDFFSLSVSSGYTASGPLSHIQLATHSCP